MVIHMLKENSVLKLGEKYEYIVVFSTMYEGYNYVYLTNLDNHADSCFYKNTNDGHLEIVKDNILFNNLLKLFEERK